MVTENVLLVHVAVSGEVMSPAKLRVKVESHVPVSVTPVCVGVFAAGPVIVTQPLCPEAPVVLLLPPLKPEQPTPHAEIAVSNAKNTIAKLELFI